MPYNLLNSSRLKHVIAEVVIWALCYVANAQSDMTNKAELACPIDTFPIISLGAFSRHLLKKQKDILDSVINKLRDYPSCSIKITTYSDDGMKTVKPQELALSRVINIMQYFVDHKIEGHRVFVAVSADEQLENKVSIILSAEGILKK